MHISEALMGLKLKIHNEQCWELLWLSKGVYEWINQKKKGRLNEETIFLFNKCVKLSLGFPGGSVVKNPPAKQET